MREMRRKRGKNTTTRTMSLKRKMGNALLLIMLVVIAVGIYYNIYNSRAEKVVEILATAIDNYAYLEDEEFKLEAKRIENDLYEISMPENINGKNVLEILDITLENGNSMNAEIINSQAEYQAEEDASEGTLEGELNTDINKKEDEENTEKPTQPEQTEPEKTPSTEQEQPQEPEQTKPENTETPNQTEQEITTTPEEPKDQEQEKPEEPNTDQEQQTPEEPTQTEPENTETPEQTTPEDGKIQIVDGKIQLTREQIANNKIILQVKYDVAILEKVEQEGETVYNKNFLSQKTEEERNAIEITEETEVVYSKTLKHEDEAHGKLVELKGYLPINAEIRAEEVSQEKLQEIFGEKKVDVAYDIKIVIPIEKKAILKEDGTVIGQINEGNTFVAEDGTIIGQLTEQNTIVKEDGTIIGEIAEDGTITGELAKTGTLADELADGVGTVENKIKLGTITEYIERNPEDFGEICEVTIKDANIVTESEVFHVKEDNTYEQVTVTGKKNESISFEATTFSIYAVAAANEGIALAAEDGTWPRMSIGDYVFDSTLFRHFDGTNNTGYHGHSTSTDTWTDIMGKANMTLNGTYAWGSETLRMKNASSARAGAITPSSITASGGGLTVQLVVKYNTADPDLVHADTGASKSSGFDFHRDTAEGRGGFGVTIYHSSGSTSLFENGSYSNDSDLYYNVAFTYDNSSKALKLYINGQLVKSTTCSGTIVFNKFSGDSNLPDNTITINSNRGNNESHDANYGSILMYYRALTGDEIKQNVGAKGFTSAQPQYWKNVECVPIRIMDNVGLATGASIQYAWSTSNSSAPTSGWTNASFSYSAGAKSATAIASGYGKSGWNYLWVKVITLKDTSGNGPTETHTFYDYYRIVNQTPSIEIGDYVTDGLIRHYEGVNNTGNGHSSSTTTWRDLSGHYEGTLHNTTLRDESISFNGSSSYAAIGKIDASEGLSLDITLNLQATPGEEDCIIGNYHTGGWGLYVSSDRKPRFCMYNGSSYTTATSSTALELGTAYTITATFNGSALGLYIDGTSVGSASISSSSVQAAPVNNTITAIGGNPNGSAATANFANMFVYSVRIYNRAITTTEMAQNRTAEGVRTINNGDSVAIRMTDNCSGVSSWGIYYAWSTSNTTAPTSWSGTQTGTASASRSISTSATASGLSGGNYYLWVRVVSSNTGKDSVGNFIAVSDRVVSKHYFKVRGIATASGKTLTYNGSAQTGVEGTGVSWSGTTSATNSNTVTYKAYATPTEDYTWSDGTKTQKTIEWTMNKKSVAVTWGSTTTFTYNGSAQAPTASASSGVSGETLNITRTTATNVGSYTSTASISSVTGGQANASNYTLTNTTKAFTITRANTATASGKTLTYNGTLQTGVEGTGVSWSGKYTAINSNTLQYEAIATPTSNYAWSDGSYGAKTIKWTMNKKSVAVTWGSTTTFTYNGSAQAPTASASSGVSGETLNITRTTATNVGSHTSTASISSVTGGQANASNYTLTNTTKAFTIVANSSAPTISVSNTWNGSAYNGSTWVNATNFPVTSVITFSDSSGSGINAGSLQWRSSSDNSNWGSWTTITSNTSTSTYTDTWTGEGLRYGQYRIANNAGTYGTSSSFPLRIDNTNPVLVNGDAGIQISNITSAGYTVTVTVSDALSGVSAVRFPTWTQANGQDDLPGTWPLGTNKGNGVWEYQVKTSEHNNETGLYNTHVYVYDNAGNQVAGGVNGIALIAPDTTQPTATGLTLSTTYTTNGQLRVTANGVTDPVVSGQETSGVNRVTWYVTKNGSYVTGYQAATSDGQWYKDINISSFGEGEYKVGVVIYDNAGNMNDTTDSNQSTSHIGWIPFYYDKTGPSATVTTTTPSPTTASSITYVINFSEGVTGFDASDVSVTNGTKGTFSGTTAISTGLSSLTLSGSQSVPVFTSNTLALSTNKKYVVSFDYKCASGTNQFDVDLWPDDLPQYTPIATTTLQHMDLIFTSSSSNMGSCNLRFFDDVQESSESDITISNISLKEVKEGTVSGGESTYVLVVTNSSSCTQTVSVPAGKASDAAGNTNTASNTVSMVIDRTAPTITASPASASNVRTQSVTITAADTGGAGLATNNSYQYYLSTSSSGVEGGSWTNYSSGTAFSIGSGITGTRYLYVRTVSDKLGNVSTANGTMTAGYHRFGAYVFDNTAPTVTVSTTTTSPTNASSITYTFTFSESVTGFTADDITVTNGTKGTFSGSGASYTLVVTNSGSCTQTVSVAAGKCTDTAGNNNTASNTVSIVIDRDVPKVIIGNHVADGLIAHYEANNNTGIGHNGSATTLKNLAIREILPDGYQQLSYIESTGGQVIRTGVTGTARWEFDIQFTGLSSLPLSQRMLMGYGGSGGEYWGVVEDGTYGLASWGHMSVQAGGIDNVIHNYGENGQYYLEAKGSQYHMGPTDVSAMEYKIFALSDDGTAFPNKAKLYRAKCIQNGVLIRDFIPCINPSGAVGLYDSVNGVFYGNLGSGSFTAGSVIEKNDGIINGATVNTNYLTFDGTDDWVNLGQISVTNAVTLEATVEISSIQSGFRSILSNQESGGIALYLQDGKPGVQAYIDSASGYVYPTTTEFAAMTAISTNTKHHIAATYDGTTLKTFLDGSLVWSKAVSGSIKPTTNNTVMAMGGGPSGSTVNGEQFAGKIYDARIYNKALTQAQIEQNMNSEGNTTWSKTSSVPVVLADDTTGLATGASVSYGWSTNTTTAPESYTTANLASYSAGAISTSFTATSSGLTGQYYLWVKVTTLKDTMDNTVPANSVIISSFPYNLDNEGPTYTSVEIKNVTKDGYDVYVYGVTDLEKSGVNRVQFPTWTDANGQDDIQTDWWSNSVAKGINQGNGTWYYRVNASDHNYEEGFYNTHIYFYDNLGNETGITTNGAIIDRTAPTLEITASENSPTNASSITYTFTFSDAISESIVGFTADDITVTNGTKGAFSGSGKVYTLVVTNSGTCVQTVTVDTGVCTDEAENGNIGASKTIVIDKTGPTISFNPNTNTTWAKSQTTTVSVVEGPILTASDLTAEDYGGTITNYDPTNGSSVGWRIFHADAESDTIYLIADDYVDRTFVPNGRNEKAINESSSYSRGFGMGDIGSDTSSASKYLGWEDISDTSIANRWLKQYKDAGFTSTNINMKATAYLLDTNQWAGFKDSAFASYAIGGPTIEMFAESYKVTHPSKYIETEASSSTGYQVKWSTDSSFSDSISGIDDYNSLYNIESSNNDDIAYGMWVASPSAFNAYYVMYVYYGGSVRDRAYFQLERWSPPASFSRVWSRSRKSWRRTI